MSDPSRYDVIVVGAGPSGCSAAYDLAESGLSVLLLDRYQFPRLKPCAGGFTMKAKHALRFSIDHLIQRSCSVCELGYNDRKTKILRGKHPIVAMTERSEFDAYHLEQCLAKGVAFACMPKGLALSGTQGDWCAKIPGREFHSTHLIGADGANSQVRRTFSIFPERQAGFGVETTIPMEQPDQYEMRFDFGVVDRGYGWVFPKGDHLNVGLYSMDKIPRAKETLTEYCQKRVGDVKIGRIVGHSIPHNGHLYRHRGGDPLLVGDAAGFVDPLMGEGLYNAIRSGQLAAEAIVAMARGERDSYNQLIREVTQDLASYRRETLFFYNHLNWGYRAMTSAPIAYVLMKGYALGKPVRWPKRHLPLLPFLKPPTK